MGTPLLLEVLQRPGTSGTAAVLIAIYLFITARRITYADVGLSYEQCLERGELYRVWTAQLSHIDLLHLLFNVSALWSVSTAELGDGGTVMYLRTSALLLVVSGAVTLLFYYILGVRLGRERYLRVTAVGYSAVIFGWMTLLAARGKGAFSVLGVAEMPMWASPLVTLVLTSIIVPQASFLGHLAGIVAGFAVAFGLFGWLTASGAAALVAWLVVLSLVPLARSGRLPFVTALGPSEPPGDVETGSALRIVNGVLERR
ncbi:hypothetical protein WJX81_006649 [Elliptochloris bilobata]|uniref:Peptidase S54 rhomboid domain-containing protein n=1 Tax=Elliptochloris bilobata TaxID=381761 RepID=A0AAW1QVV8_9CHLO